MMHRMTKMKGLPDMFGGVPGMGKPGR